MKFRVIREKTASGAHSPIYLIEQNTGQGVGWINRYLDRDYVSRLANTTLYIYAHNLLHFVRWWESVHHTGDILQAELTPSTLLDYVRFQSSRQPPPSASTINDRVACADRAIRNEFPDAPCQAAYGFHQAYLHRRPLGLDRPRFELSRLRVKEPRLTIVPLSVEEVARFWSSFRTARDLAIVGLMLMHGLAPPKSWPSTVTTCCCRKASYACAARATSYAPCPWPRSPPNCSITTCAWSGPILARRHCSSC
jgi:hypothetical protein